MYNPYLYGEIQPEMQDGAGTAKKKKVVIGTETVNACHEHQKNRWFFKSHKWKP